MYVVKKYSLDERRVRVSGGGTGKFGKGIIKSEDKLTRTRESSLEKETKEDIQGEKRVLA